jgi:hypothetical protein
MPDDTAKTHVFLKAIIFLALFLGLYTSLIALMPSEFYSSASSGSTFDYSFLSLEDVRRIRFLDTTNITRQAFLIESEWFDFTPNATYKMKVLWVGSTFPTSPNTIFFQHCTWESPIGFPAPQFDEMQIENLTKTFWGSPAPYHYILTKAHAVAHWSSLYNASIFDPVQCEHARTKVWIFDQNTTRNNISQAWDDGKLTFTMGFGYDDMFAKQTSLDILGRILLFQAPTVWGLTGDMATIVNLILTVPFYAMVGVLIFLIVIAFIPF